MPPPGRRGGPSEEVREVAKSVREAMREAAAAHAHQISQQQSALERQEQVLARQEATVAAQAAAMEQHAATTEALRGQLERQRRGLVEMLKAQKAAEVEHSRDLAAVQAKAEEAEAVMVGLRLQADALGTMASSTYGSPSPSKGIDRLGGGGGGGGDVTAAAKAAEVTGAAGATPVAEISTAFDRAKAAVMGVLETHGISPSPVGKSKSRPKGKHKEAANRPSLPMPIGLSPRRPLDFERHPGAELNDHLSELTKGSSAKDRAAQRTGPRARFGTAGGALTSARNSPVLGSGTQLAEREAQWRVQVRDWFCPFRRSTAGGFACDDGEVDGPGRQRKRGLRPKVRARVMLLCTGTYQHQSSGKRSGQRALALLGMPG